MRISSWLDESASRLGDEELLCELRCAERCALLCTRTRRELALKRVACYRRELERRRTNNLAATATTR